LQDQIAAKKTLLESVAGQANGILAATKAPFRELGMPSAMMSAAAWGETLKLAPPLQVIRSQLEAANEVFSLGIKVRSLTWLVLL
jgi:hypothetical protein